MMARLRKTSIVILSKTTFPIKINTCTYRRQDKRYNITHFLLNSSYLVTYQRMHMNVVVSNLKEIKSSHFMFT